MPPVTVGIATVLTQTLEYQYVIEIYCEQITAGI